MITFKELSECVFMYYSKNKTVDTYHIEHKRDNYVFYDRDNDKLVIINRLSQKRFVFCSLSELDSFILLIMREVGNECCGFTIKDIEAILLILMKQEWIEDGICKQLDNKYYLEF